MRGPPAHGALIAIALMGPVVYHASLLPAFAIVTEASLSFLGPGGAATDAELRDHVERRPRIRGDAALDEPRSRGRGLPHHRGFNFLGAAIRDALDPRARRLAWHTDG